MTIIDKIAFIVASTLFLIFIIGLVFEKPLVCWWIARTDGVPYKEVRESLRRTGAWK